MNGFKASIISILSTIIKKVEDYTSWDSILDLQDDVIKDLNGLIDYIELIEEGQK